MQLFSPQTEQEWENYFAFRWLILRKPWNQPEGSEKDEHENTAFHVMAVSNNELIGVGRLHRINTDTGQIRYMAVSHYKQSQGVGSKILCALEEQAFKDGYTRLILNARDSALEFYQHHGYHSIGKGHTLYDQITHTQMQKAL